jgi:hypothetical protein
MTFGMAYLPERVHIAHNQRLGTGSHVAFMGFHFIATKNSFSPIFPALKRGFFCVNQLQEAQSAVDFGGCEPNLN